MKCPFCNAWSEVNETRGARRRRQCANGHRFTTQEVVTSYSARKVEDRNRQAAQRVLAGETQTDVAAQFCMPRTELSRYMRAHYPDHDSRRAGQLARQESAERKAVRAAARSLLAAGWKPLAVANQTNTPLRTVQRWAKGMKT